MTALNPPSTMVAAAPQAATATVAGGATVAATGTGSVPRSAASPYAGPAPNPPRLKRRAEFLRAASAGRKAAFPGLVLQALPRDDSAPARCGFTVTKRVGNSVVRNRARRRLREAARIVLADAPLAGHDVVLIGRAGTLDRPFAQLLDDVERALRRTGARGA